MRINISWLDIKLGLRMLRRYPGLTTIGGIAMAFAIAASASVFAFLSQLVSPRLPLEEGDRIVGIRLQDIASGSVEKRASFDFGIWRREVRSIESLGAFRTVDRNLVSTDGRSEPIQLAEITASGFRVARVAALAGRTLVDADEQAGAPAVMVLRFDIWQSRFGGAPGIVGQSVRLGTTVVTVVGVMPESFRFPVSHDAWIPLGSELAAPEGREGPEINVFGRLAAGVGLDNARTELATIGLRLASDHPDSHAYLRPEIVPYAQSIRNIAGLQAAALLSINVFLIMLLVLVCGNVALLMFARAAARESEIVVRTALGAGRGRIIAQLFAEALVLAVVSAPFGLVAAGFLLRWWLTVASIDFRGRLPFWLTDSLAPSTVVYALALTLVGAIVSGIVPALKVTGRGVETRLRAMSAGGGGLRFGGIWTAVIIAQVALTLTFPAAVFLLRQSVVRYQSDDIGFPAAEFLSARLETDDVARASSTYDEIERRLTSEPGAAGVTFTSRLPRTVHPRRRLEIDGAEAAVNTVSVAVNYFDALGVRLLSGRRFGPSDIKATPTPVIVNESFVRNILQGRNPLGRRLRYRGDSDQEPWHEIVGVVADLGTGVNDTPDALYHPMPSGAITPAHIAVHVVGDPAAFVPRLRAIAAAVDPTLRLYDVLPLTRVGAETWNDFDFLWRLLSIMSSLAILLSMTGIYAAVSFAVSRRRREIGVRIALGARPIQVVVTTLRQPLFQVGLGVIAGAGLVLALVTLSSAGLSISQAAVVAAYAALMMGVCMLACVVPIMRVLRIEPTEALRAD